MSIFFSSETTLASPYLTQIVCPSTKLIPITSDSIPPPLPFPPNPPDADWALSAAYTAAGKTRICWKQLEIKNIEKMQCSLFLSAYCAKAKANWHLCAFNCFFARGSVICGSVQFGGVLNGANIV